MEFGASPLLALAVWCCASTFKCDILCVSFVCGGRLYEKVFKIIYRLYRYLTTKQVVKNLCSFRMYVFEY